MAFKGRNKKLLTTRLRSLQSDSLNDVRYAKEKTETLKFTMELRLCNFFHSPSIPRTNIQQKQQNLKWFPSKGVRKLHRDY